MKDISQETIKLIEDKAKQLCIENGVKYPNNILPLVRTTIFHLIKFILTDPTILKSIPLYILPEMQKQMQDVLEKEEDKWVSVHELPTENKLYNIYFSNSAGSHVDSGYWDGENFIDGNGEEYTNVTHYQPLPSPPSLTK